MFLVKSNEAEIADALEKNLNIINNADLYKYHQRRAEVLSNLATAADLLENSDLKSEAIIITNLMIKIAQISNELEPLQSSDPAMVGLDSQTMLDNLEEKGWMFNADDTEVKEPGRMDFTPLEEIQVEE